MVWIPFRRELNDLFEKDDRQWLKVIGGAFVGGFVAFGAIRHGLPDHEGATPLYVSVVTVATCAIVAAGAVLVLGLKDVVKRRLENGQPVNFILRAYLTSGLVSLAIWVLTVFGVAFFFILVMAAKYA